MATAAAKYRSPIPERGLHHIYLRLPTTLRTNQVLPTGSGNVLLLSRTGSRKTAAEAVRVHRIVRVLVLIACAYAESAVAEMQIRRARRLCRRCIPMIEYHPIASDHARAICGEIGERLRFALRDDYADLPPRLRELVRRLAELDCDAPSLVPTIEEMTRPLRRPPDAEHAYASANLGCRSRMSVAICGDGLTTLRERPRISLRSSGLRTSARTPQPLIREQLDRLAEAAHGVFADMFELELAADEIGKRARQQHRSASTAW